MEGERKETIACTDKHHRKPPPATHTMGNSRSSPSYDTNLSKYLDVGKEEGWKKKKKKTKSKGIKKRKKSRTTNARIMGRDRDGRS